METNWGIIGHQNIVRYLENCLKKNRLVNTYLFYGIGHLGKTTAALKFAERLLGEASGHHPDLFELSLQDGKKDISIDQVREWQRWLGLKAFLNGYKVGIIHQAENLNLESANALLKTIEEPTVKTILILITSAWEQLLPTIVSRSQQIHFLPVNEKELTQAVCQRVNNLKAKEILEFSCGRPGLAIRFSEDKEFFQEFCKLRAEVIGLFSAPLSQRFSFVEQFLNSKDYQENAGKALNFFQHLEFVLKEKLLISIASEAADSRKKLIKLFGLLNQGRQVLKNNVQPRLALENLLINL